MRVICVSLLLIAAQTVMALPNHSHDTQTAPVPVPKAKPLTHEQAASLVLEARNNYKQQLIDALTTFNTSAGELAPNADEKTRDLIASLRKTIDQQVAALKDNQYVTDEAAQYNDFNIEPLKQLRTTYLEQIGKTDDAYFSTLRAALAKDIDGHIGEMMMQQLDESNDANLMWLLMDHFWHHQEFDTPPGSYERIIRLCYRYVELEPQSPTVYSNAAWLLWSRWVTWKMNKDKVTIGEGDDKAALRFLLRGREANMDNAHYHFDAAMTLWGLAKNHDASYYQFIVESLKLGDTKVTETRLQIRIRLTLGHAYRYQKKYDEARKAYQSVLVIDPEHKIATRILGELEEETKEPAVAE